MSSLPFVKANSQKNRLIPELCPHNVTSSNTISHQEVAASSSNQDNSEQVLQTMDELRSLKKEIESLELGINEREAWLDTPIEYRPKKPLFSSKYTVRSALRSKKPIKKRAPPSRRVISETRLIRKQMRAEIHAEVEVIEATLELQFHINSQFKDLTHEDEELILKDSRMNARE